MTETIFQGLITKSGDTVCRLPILVRMSYDACDPLAFTMAFKSGDDEFVAWEASRDLLVEAVATDTLVGQGDVKFQRDRFLGKIGVCVKSPEGHVHVGMPLEHVADFLSMTEHDAAEGVKALPSIVDAALEGILGGA